MLGLTLSACRRWGFLMTQTLLCYPNDSNRKELTFGLLGPKMMTIVATLEWQW